MAADGFKITYATLTAPGEEVHRAFEAALAEVRAKALGQEHPLRIGGEPRAARETFPDVFTGSKDVGLAIYRGFTAPLPRPCILELGGKNPAIVTRAADLDRAAEGIARFERVS